MKDRITKLCQSCYYQLHQIRTVRHSLTPTAIKTLVHAFVCTCIDFANSLFYYRTSAYLLDRLQSVRNLLTLHAEYLIFKIGKYDPISSSIQLDLHWLPNRFRVYFKLNPITSNCLAGRAPEYLMELCHSVNDISARSQYRSSSWYLDFGRNVLVAEVSSSPRRSYGICFLSISDFSTTNIDF